MSMYDCAACGEIRCEHVIADSEKQQERIKNLESELLTWKSSAVGWKFMYDELYYASDANNKDYGLPMSEWRK